MVLALPDFFQIMLKIMLGFENYARFCKVCFSSMKHKTFQNYNFFLLQLNTTAYLICSDILLPVGVGARTDPIFTSGVCPVL